MNRPRKFWQFPGNGRNGSQKRDFRAKSQCKASNCSLYRKHNASIRIDVMNHSVSINGQNALAFGYFTTFSIAAAPRIFFRIRSTYSLPRGVACGSLVGIV